MYLFLKGSGRGQLFIELQCLTQALVFSVSSCQILIIVYQDLRTHIYFNSILQFQGEGSNIVNSRVLSGKFVSNLLFLGSCNVALSIIENQEILSGFHFIILRCMIMVTSRHPEGRLSTIHRDTRLEQSVCLAFLVIGYSSRSPPPPPRSFHNLLIRPKLNPEKKTHE